MNLIRLVTGDLFSASAVHRFFHEKGDTIIQQYGVKVSPNPVSYLSIDDVKARLWNKEQMIGDQSQIIPAGMALTIMPIFFEDGTFRYAFRGVGFALHIDSESCRTESGQLFGLTTESFNIPECWIPDITAPEKYLGQPNLDFDYFYGEPIGQSVIKFLEEVKIISWL